MTNTKLVRFYRPLGDVFLHMKETLREEAAVAFGVHVGTQINATQKVTVAQLLTDLWTDGWELVDAYWSNFTPQGKTVPEPRPTFVFVKKGAESSFVKGDTLPTGAESLLQAFARIPYGSVYVWENLVGDNPEDPASHDTINFVAPLKYIKPKEANKFGINPDGTYYPATPTATLPPAGTSDKELRLQAEAGVVADPPATDAPVATVEEEKGA